MKKFLFTALIVGLPIIFFGLLFTAMYWYTTPQSESASTSASASAAQETGTPSSATGNVATNTGTAQNTTAPTTPTIYVSIVTHSEDTQNIGTPNFSTDEASTLSERDGVAKFAAMAAGHGVKYDWQSDWNFLLGLQKYDKGSALTNNKPLARYLVEDLGMSADPHSHQHNGYTYADVAYLLQTLGVTPSGIVGGFIASPASSSEYGELSQPLTGSKYPLYTWTPTALWGGGTGLHIDETEQWTSGIWIPKSASDFFTPVSTGTPVIGRYDGDFNGLDHLLAKQSAGELEAGNMYTITITTNQNLFTDDYIAAFEKQLLTYADETAAGKIVWTTLPNALSIWKTQYQSKPTILKYDGDGSRSSLSPVESSTSTTTSKPSSSSASTGTKPTSSFSGSGLCGDGICDSTERMKNVCPADCS